MMKVTFTDGRIIEGQWPKNIVNTMAAQDFESTNPEEYMRNVMVRMQQIKPDADLECTDAKSWLAILQACGYILKIEQV